MLLSGSRNMRGRVDEDLDEYEDEYEDGYADEYEDEEEEDEEVQEDEPLSEEAVKYLNLRDKLKERLRLKLRKENGVRSNNSKDQLRAAPLERFGSFFGPSKPVIADRVIQESKSFLETQHLAAKASTSTSQTEHVRKAPMSSSSGTKNGVINKPRAPPVKSKAQIIKATRDYSFLLSDDAELPKQSKDPGPSKNSAPRPDARSAQVPTRSSQPSSHPSGKRMGGHEQRMNGHEPRMNGHEPRMNGHEQRKPQPNKQPGSSNGRPAQTAAPQKLSSGNNKRSVVSSDSGRQVDLRKQPQTSRQLSSSNGNGHARPAGPVRSAAPKVVPPKKPLPYGERRVSVGSVERKGPVGSSGTKMPAVSKSSTPNGQRMPVANGQRMPVVKSQTSGASNRMEHKPNIQRSSEGRILKKENAPDSRSQMTRPQKQDPYRANSQKDGYSKKPKPALQSSLQRSGASSRDQYSRKRKAEESDEDQFDFRSEIRKMFGRPTRYYDDVDDDDDCMEVGFDTIQQEEKRSARIARKEDEEELIKIMEEERLEKERLKRKAKMRKMGQR